MGFFNSCCQFNAIIVVLFAVFIGVDPVGYKVLISFLVYFDVPFVNHESFNVLHREYPASDSEVYEAVAKRMIKIREVSSFEELAEDWDTPAVIRQLVPDCLHKLTEYPSDKVVKLYNIKHHDGGKVCRAGFEYTGDITQLHLSSFFNGSETFSDAYASFHTFLSDEQIENVAPNFVKKRGLARDTNFVANFTNSAVSTKIHAAGVVRSWSLQCAGEKRWLIWPAKTVNPKVHAISTPAVIPTHWNEELVFSEDVDTYQTVMRGGDLLYFPPNWLHLVQTRPGQNIMLNFREVSVFHSMRLNPLLTLATVGIRMLDTIKGKMAGMKESRLGKEQISEQFDPFVSRNLLEQGFMENKPEGCHIGNSSESALVQYLYNSMSY